MAFEVGSHDVAVGADHRERVVIMRPVLLEIARRDRDLQLGGERLHGDDRSEEHTSELQSLMRISYAVFCLKKKKQKHQNRIPIALPMIRNHNKPDSIPTLLHYHTELT